MIRDFLYLCIFAIFLLVICISSCSSPGRTTGAGAIAGAATGAGVGALASPGDQGHNRFRNVLIGTAAGSAVGAAAGYVIGSDIKDREEKAREEGKAQALKEYQSSPEYTQGATPRLIPARAEAHWVPDQVRGNTFIPGHFEFQIVQGARWER